MIGRGTVELACLAVRFNMLPEVVDTQLFGPFLFSLKFQKFQKGVPIFEIYEMTNFVIVGSKSIQTYYPSCIRALVFL